MWPFKNKSEFTSMSSLHAVMLILMALTLITNIIVLVKVKMMMKDQAKVRDALTQIITQYGPGSPADRRMMMPPRPTAQPGTPTSPKPTPSPTPTR